MAVILATITGKVLQWSDNPETGRVNIRCAPHGWSFSGTDGTADEAVRLHRQEPV